MQIQSQTNRLAVVSLGLALLPLLTCPLSAFGLSYFTWNSAQISIGTVISWLLLIATYLLPPISLVLAVVSRKQILRSEGAQGGENLALIAISLSVIFIGYIALMLGLALLGLL